MNGSVAEAEEAKNKLTVLPIVTSSLPLCVIWARNNTHHSSLSRQILSPFAAGLDPVILVICEDAQATPVKEGGPERCSCLARLPISPCLPSSPRHGYYSTSIYILASSEFSRMLTPSSTKQHPISASHHSILLLISLPSCKQKQQTAGNPHLAKEVTRPAHSPKGGLAPTGHAIKSGIFIRERTQPGIRE